MREQVLRARTQATGESGRGALTTKGFESESQRIGRLVAERFDIGFVDVGGWDTHVAQGAGTGYLAGRFAELGRGLAAIADTMGSRWDDTVVVVLSEFGRTFRENGNRGTDHGHGTVYWVLGGAVRGGGIAGDQVALTQPALFQNRDYPVLNEYRGVLAGLLARLYALNDASIERVFPDARVRDLGLV